MNKYEILSILYGKETKEDYNRFKTIENNIELYKYIEDISNMLKDDKSYIRLRGFIILCNMSKYDDNKLIDKYINDMLDILDDDKPTIIRMALKAINTLLLYKPYLSDLIVCKFNNINYNKYKDTMRPLIKKDIDCILNHI